MLRNMAPRLAVSQLDLIRDALLSSPPLTTSQIARIADCSPRSVRTIRSNLHCFGNVRAPPNGIGRRRSVTPLMLNALCDHLLEKPDLYQDEMVLFLWDEFRVLVTVHSIGRALHRSVGLRKHLTELPSNGMPTYEISTFIIYPSFAPIILSMWMNLGVIKEWDSDELVGLLLASRQSRCRTSNEISGTRSFRRMLRTGLSCLGCSGGLLMLRSSRILSNSCLSIVAGGLSLSLSSSWIMHLFTTLSDSMPCALLLVLS